VADSCDHGAWSSGSTKGGEFLYQLNDYQPLKKESAPWSLDYKGIKGQLIQQHRGLVQGNSTYGSSVWVRKDFLPTVL
jgi:hypothetical protein